MLHSYIVKCWVLMDVNFSSEALQLVFPYHYMRLFLIINLICAIDNALFYITNLMMFTFASWGDKNFILWPP